MPAVADIDADSAATDTKPAEKKEKDVTEMIGELSEMMATAVAEIDEINSDVKLLALNARIEAARAGSAGAAFAVVSEEMQNLAGKTSEVAGQLASDTQRSITELNEIIGTKVRGTRLSDLALTNVDLIDRNLYERTCDVRWWATDSSAVDALTLKTPEAIQHASQRLGVILSAYTVYHDLVLCDLDGNIIANGRPDLYHSAGRSASQSSWFKEAARSSSGDSYGFETAHRSPLVNNQSVLVYSCGVREDGRSNGELLGVLGILFNWEEFAQTIMEEVPLPAHEKDAARVCIVDNQGRILADSKGRQLEEFFEVPNQETLFADAKNFALIDIEGEKYCIGHARAPGFETYSTGWHSIVMQPVTIR